MTEEDRTPVTILAPIVIDLGKTRRKRIKQLKRGRGRLMDEIRQAVNDVRINLSEEDQGKEFVPVVLLYRSKRKRNRTNDGLLPFIPLIFGA